jgi:predicted Rossmann fold flavoprotein
VFRVAAETAAHLVIATGGPSMPKMGATGVACEIAQRFGLPVVPPRPALVPLTLGAEAFRGISGVSCPVTAHAGGAAFAEAALFTHRGLSGPAILQASSYWTPGTPIVLELIANAEEILSDARQRSPRSRLRFVLSEHLPDRLAEVLAERIGLKRESGNTSDAELQRAVDTLRTLTFHPTGTGGFAKAEVTAGGISTDALSSRAMEAKTVPGLYAIGETVDVTGWLGGYNVQVGPGSGGCLRTPVPAATARGRERRRATPGAGCRRG